MELVHALEHVASIAQLMLLGAAAIGAAVILIAAIRRRG